MTDIFKKAITAFDARSKITGHGIYITPSSIESSNLCMYPAVSFSEVPLNSNLYVIDSSGNQMNRIRAYVNNNDYACMKCHRRLLTQNEKEFYVTLDWLAKQCNCKVNVLNELWIQDLVNLHHDMYAIRFNFKEMWHKVKVMSKDETLESLAIENDLRSSFQ